MPKLYSNPCDFPPIPHLDFPSSNVRCGSGENSKTVVECLVDDGHHILDPRLDTKCPFTAFDRRIRAIVDNRTEAEHRFQHVHQMSSLSCSPITYLAHFPLKLLAREEQNKHCLLRFVRLQAHRHGILDELA